MLTTGYFSSYLFSPPSVKKKAARLWRMARAKCYKAHQVSEPQARLGGL